MFWQIRRIVFLTLPKTNSLNHHHHQQPAKLSTTQTRHKNTAAQQSRAALCMDDDYQDLKTLYLTEIFASKFVWSVVQLSSHVQWFFPEKNNPSSAS